MDKKCPFCGALLPEEASFCPRCARSINRRSEVKPPARIPARVLRAALLLILVLIAGGFLIFSTRPKTYDAFGEVNYTDRDGTYQILINVSNDRYRSMTSVHQDYGDEDRYRFPLRLYINHRDTGADAGGIFWGKVKSSEVRIEQPDSATPVQCTAPAFNDAYQEAAQVSFIDFYRQSPEQSQLVWTLEMENGDLICLRMDFSITFREIYTYDSEQTDLSDSAALQALVDQLAVEREQDDIVNIYLPAVTYTETVVLHDRSFNIYGSEENGQRTTFTAGVQMRSNPHRTWITYLTGIDFVGDGSGVGLSAANRVWARECRFINWKTGVLAYGGSAAWVNTTDCVFEKNQTGLYYNAVDGSPSDSRFTGNAFTDNETAVLLENVPTGVRMNFGECVFTGNGTDIDNRCEQPLDISEAIFQ